MSLNLDNAKFLLMFSRCKVSGPVRSSGAFRDYTKTDVVKNDPVRHIASLTLCFLPQQNLLKEISFFLQHFGIFHECNPKVFYCFVSMANPEMHGTGLETLVSVKTHGNNCALFHI